MQAGSGQTDLGDDGAIAPALMLAAYRAGIFPMADARDDPTIYWVEPRRRAILPLDGFHASHSLLRTLRRGRFSVSCNRAFAEVLDRCAAPRRAEHGETWINARLAATYRALHAAGHAHAIEVWADGALVGGLYGVGFDRVFCGESMFSAMADASKVALVWLIAALRRAGAELLDCQFLTAHLASLGAVEISRGEYGARLAHAQRRYAGGGSSAGGGGSAGAAPAAGGAAAPPRDLPTGFAALCDAIEEAGSSSSPGNFIAQSLIQTS